MEDSQRQAMYDAWARGKKWMKVEILYSTRAGDSWKACAEHTFGCIERPTKQTAIAAIQGKLAERGYEISNLAELFGIQEERRTFLEWLRKTELQRKHKENWQGLDRVLPSPDYEGRAANEYPSRTKRRILNDLDYNK